MQSEEEKRRRLAALQQQQGIKVQTPLQRMTPQKAPTAQQLVQMRIPTAIRNVPVPKQPTPSLFERAVETVLPNLGVLGRSYAQALGEITGVNESARRAQQQSLQLGTDIIKNLNQRLQDPNLSQAQRQNIQSSIGRIAQSDIRLAEQMGQTATEQAKALDPAKIAAAYGLTALDIATLGTTAQAPKVLARLGAATPAVKRAATIGGGAAIGGVYGPLDTLTRRGSEATPEELAQSAAIGGVAGAAIPATFGIFGRLVQPVRRLLGRETAQEAAQMATREAEQAAAERTAREAAQQAGETTAQRIAREAVPTPAPAAGRSATIVSDKAITNIVARKSQADIDKAVRDIYPDIDVPSLNAASAAIKQAAAPNEVRAVLDSVAEIKRTIDENLPTTTVPTTGTQITTARLAEEVAQPTGPTRITQAPTQPQAPQMFGRYTQQAVQAAEEAKGRYSKPTIRRRIMELWDPRQAGVKLDRVVKSAYKKEGKTFTQADSIDLALSQSSQSTVVAQDFLKNSNIAKVIQKYGYNTPAANEFIYYASLKRDIERELDGRSVSYRNMSLGEKQNLVSLYEKQNPKAQLDLDKIAADINKVQDMTITGPNAFIDKAQLEAARTKKDGSKYKYYIPMARALPEDVERAVMSGQNLAGLGRQKVLQEMTGSDIPVDISWDAITNYVETVYRQLGNARVQRILEQRVKEGLIPGARFIQTAEQTAAIKTAKLQVKQLVKDVKKLESKVRISSRQERKLRSEINKLNKEGLNLSLRKGGKQPLPNMTPEQMAAFKELPGKTKTASSFFNSLVQADDAQLVRIRNKIATRDPKLAAKVDEVLIAKQELAKTQAERKIVGQEIIDITPDSTTGLQTIIGRDINGNTYRIELPPEYANVLQGFDKKQLPAILKATRAAQEPFRQAWVGLLNPPFQISTSIWNAVMAPIISARGYKLYTPSAAKAAVNGFFNRGEMIDLIRKNGGVSFGGNLEKLTSDKTAQALAKSNDLVSKSKWYGELQNGRGFRRTWSKLNEYGGRVDQATRNAAATVTYNQSLKNGLTKEQAIAEALKEWNNVLPDYANVSNLVRSVDAAVPFTAASVAGTRTLLRALRDRPVQTIAKLGAAGSAVAGIIYYNLSSEAGQKFYEDMKLAKKDYLLDNNVILVLPGAKKDEKTGEWSGIVKIPVAPELRTINKAIRETMYEVANGRGVPVGTIALSGFDFLTGKLRDQSSPLFQTGVAISTGIDPRTGRQIYDETMDNAQKAEAIKEYIRRNLGLPGQMAGGNAYQEFFNGFIDRVYGAKGTTAGSRFFQNQNKAIQDAGLNPNELDAYYGSVSPRSKDLTGNLIKDKTYYDSASRAITWLRYPKTFEVSRKVDQLSRAQGNPGDPLFDLSPEQLRVVLNLQATFSPGIYEDKAIRQLNPWLDEFNKKRSEYFDKVLSDEVKQKGSVDPMGIAIPQATPDMQTKLDKLSTLTTTADRAQFYADNPDITDFFSKQDSYERVKRGFLGLPQFDEYPTADKDTQKNIDEYNNLPKGEGPLKKDGTPSSPTRSAWIKNNPTKWDSITKQWSKQDVYRLQKEGALAVYEGIDFTEQGIKSIKDLAKSLGMSENAAGNMWANWTPAERQYLTDYLNQIQAPELPKITGIKAKQVKQYKIKLPSTTRRGARIKLQ